MQDLPPETTVGGHSHSMHLHCFKIVFLCTYTSDAFDLSDMKQHECQFVSG